MSGLICVQTVCKGYQQAISVGKELTILGQRSTQIKMNEINKLVRFFSFSHKGAVKAEVKLPKCAVSPEPSLLPYTKYGCR